MPKFKLDDPNMFYGIRDLKALPQSLSVEEFVKARQLELEHFEKDISNEVCRGRSAKQLYQNLPRNMRRRAASHNVRRLPAKIRFRMVQTTKKAGEKPVFHKKKQYSRIFEIGNSKDKRLSTHVWHAKRFKMQSLWGYKLAFKSNIKCLKQSLKAFYSECFIHDLSYLSFLLKHDYSDFLQIVDKNFGKMLLLNNQEICPTYESKLPYINSEGKIEFKTYFSLHPASSYDVKIDVTSKLLYLEDFAVFFLAGPTTREILQYIFPFSVLGYENTLLVASDIRLRTFFKNRHNPPQSKKIDLSLWIKLFSYQSSNSSTNSEYNKIDSNFNNLIIPGNLNNIELSKSCTCCILNRISSVSENEEFLLFIPKNRAIYIWRAFVLSGATVGSQTEFQFVFREFSKPFFPNDFPSTNAYKLYSEKIRHDCLKRFNAKPPSKRGINYLKNQITNPFFAPFFSLTCLNNSCCEDHFDFQINGLSFYIANFIVIGKGVVTVNDAILELDTERCIGFVTSAGYSQKRGKVSGIAVFHYCQQPESFRALALDRYFGSNIKRLIFISRIPGLSSKHQHLS